jgi:hypothetical protein
VSSAAAATVTEGWRMRESRRSSVMVINVGSMEDASHRPLGLR